MGDMDCVENDDILGSELGNVLRSGTGCAGVNLNGRIRLEQSKSNLFLSTLTLSQYHSSSSEQHCGVLARVMKLWMLSPSGLNVIDFTPSSFVC